MEEAVRNYNNSQMPVQNTSLGKIFLIHFIYHFHHTSFPQPMQQEWIGNGVEGENLWSNAKSTEVWLIRIDRYL